MLKTFSATRNTATHITTMLSVLITTHTLRIEDNKTEQDTLPHPDRFIPVSRGAFVCSVQT
jgi:hypothetical protein